MFNWLFKTESESKKLNNKELLCNAILLQNIHEVENLLNSSIDPSIDDNIMILTACSIGNCEIVKLLLQDPRINPCEAFKLCYKKQQIQMIEILLSDNRIICNNKYFDNIDLNTSNNNMILLINKKLRALNN